jgi:hypothetical protein
MKGEIMSKKEYTLEEWKAEGKRLFGDNIENWKFKCPACGRITKVIEYKEFGGQPDDAYVNCIGRWNKKGVSGLSNVKDNSNGCDWAAYGLFQTLNGGVVVDGCHIFDFGVEVKNGKGD